MAAKLHIEAITAIAKGKGWALAARRPVATIFTCKRGRATTFPKQRLGRAEILYSRSVKYLDIKLTIRFYLSEAGPLN